MSATFGPNLGLPLEAFWFEHVGWHWLYWEIIPTAALAIAMMAYGLPRDPMHFERFQKFNWFGLLVGLPAICSLVIVLYQGDRLDWFRSPIITDLALWGEQRSSYLSSTRRFIPALISVFSTGVRATFRQPCFHLSAFSPSAPLWATFQPLIWKRCVDIDLYRRRRFLW